MHGTHMKYLLVAAGALVVGLVLSGTPVQTVLPYLLIVACPLMMVAMMGGMHGHGRPGGPDARTAADHIDANDDSRNASR